MINEPCCTHDIGTHCHHRQSLAFPCCLYMQNSHFIGGCAVINIVVPVVICSCPPCNLANAMLVQQESLLWRMCSHHQHSFSRDRPSLSPASPPSPRSTPSAQRSHCCGACAVITNTVFPAVCLYYFWTASGALPMINIMHTLVAVMLTTLAAKLLVEGVHTLPKYCRTRGTTTLGECKHSIPFSLNCESDDMLSHVRSSPSSHLTCSHVTNPEPR